MSEAVGPARPKSVLIVRGAFGDMYEPAWLRALNELGCAAEMFDCHEFTSPGVLGRIERRVLAGPGIIRMRRSLIKRVRERAPDIVLLYQGHYIDRQTLETLSRHSFVVGYHNDDPFGPGSRMFRYRHFHRALRAYGGFHVYRAVNVGEALAAGVPHAGVLMSGFIPWLDYPRALSQAQRSNLEADLFFAGHCEPDQRGACLEAAAEAGLTMRIYGDPMSWRMHAPAALNTRLGTVRHIVGEDYRRAICAARVSLCFFSKKNRDEYTRRVFEITACGGFLLAERTPTMLELFPEGSSAEYFSSPAEFVEKARFYRDNPTARRQIAERGYARVHAEGHDLLNRMRQWLADVERWRDDRPRESGARPVRS